MYIVIRQFLVRDPDTNIDDVIRQLRSRLLPLYRNIKGYRSYRVVDLRDGSFGSMSIYETEKEASEANRIALGVAGESMSDDLKIIKIRVWKTLFEADMKEEGQNGSVAM